MNPDSRIYIAGHRGLVGSAIQRRLQLQGCSNLLLRTHAELDLTDERATRAFFEQHKPEYVFLAAAKVGGIVANNSFPADFIRDNLAIQTNVIHAAYLNGVKRLLFLGSSCIYPKLAPQPMQEKDLLTGPLEPTNQAYAMAKIAGIFYIEAHREEYGRRWISAMPTNLYGPRDNFDLNSSHVIPALIRKMLEAQDRGEHEVTLWGDGSPTREFLYAEDAAEGIVLAAEKYNKSDPVNLGSGNEISIKDLAELIARLTGFEGRLVWDTTQPNGQPRRGLDTSRAAREFGFRAAVDFEEGLRRTIAWYRETRQAA